MSPALLLVLLVSAAAPDAPAVAPALPAPPGVAQAPRPLSLRVTPVLHQSLVLHLSDRVTSGGLGGGAGVQVAWGRHALVQADAGLLWLVGNPVLTRLAVGAQRDGTWAPAAWATLGALWGQRVEFLDARGRRPPAPAWAVGARLSPLRFTGPRGSVSLLEAGYGVAPSDGGRWVELTLVQAGVGF